MVCLASALAKTPIDPGRVADRVCGWWVSGGVWGRFRARARGGRRRAAEGGRGTKSGHREEAGKARSAGVVARGVVGVRGLSRAGA